MANDATKVLIGKPLITGGLLCAPIGTALPTTALAALAGAFRGTGYVSEDGVVQTINAETSPIKAWGGDIVRIVETDHEVTYKFTMIEHNDVTLAAYYGDDNYVTGAVQIKAGALPHKEWVIEVKDAGKRIRIVIPDGQITERGDVNYTDDDAAGFEVTLTCFPDANGVKAYLYMDGVDVAGIPVVSSATPATTPAAGGALITILGDKFTGATSVKFGGTNATSYTVVDDDHIVAIAPARPAGSQPVTVVTPAGTSNALAFTYS